MKGSAVTSLRATTRHVGRMTHRARVLPDFLIVGGQRCGTTSMFKALTDHPAILPPPMHKGIHYFDKRYTRGLDWYRGQFPLKASLARASRLTGMKAITGESSPYYGFHPLAAERIARDLPDIRVLLLVRDPVERAISAHTHERARGYEPLEFERALDLEMERTSGERERMHADPNYDSFALQHHAYVERGRYIEQFERLSSALGPERVLVVDSHRVFEDAATAMPEVFSFLNLEPPPGARFEKHNARPRADMPKGLRDRLAEYFEPFDARLADRLGWTPRWMG